MPCPVCVSAQKAATPATSEHLSLRQLAMRYHVSRSSLHRHQQRCLLTAGTAGDSGDSGDSGDPVRSTAPVRPSHPLTQYHGEALQLQAACREAKYTDNWVYLAQALADLLVKMTEPATYGTSAITAERTHGT